MDINAKTTGNDWTPIQCLLVHYRELNNLIDLIRLLLENGADAVAKTPDGYNLLHLLCRNYQHDNLIELVRLLIERGVDVNDSDPDGWNPLHILCRNFENEERLFELVLLLKENNIDMNATATIKGREKMYTAYDLLTLKNPNGIKMKKVTEIMYNKQYEESSSRSNASISQKTYGFRLLGL